MAEKIQVGVDIRDLRIAKTGAKTYLEEIYKEFSSGKHDCEFHFFDTSIPVYTGKNIFLKLIEHLRFILWKQVMLPLKAARKGCDILFCTDYFVPIIHAGYKTIPVFYDAFFFEYPQHYNRFWLWLFRMLAIPGAKRSQCVITLTEYTSVQLSRYLGMSRDKIIPIHLAPKNLGVHNIEHQKAAGDNFEYILHVGVLEKRKNLVRLIEAFNLLTLEGYDNYKLVLIGQASSKSYIDDSQSIKDAIAGHGLEDRVLWLGYATNEELSYYYRNAVMYVFPSVNEGFGLPVIEAFHYDLPVLVADNTCLPEVGGDAVVTFDPYDPTDMKEKIKGVIDDPALRSSLIEKGRRRLKQFSWHKTAATLVNVFKETAGSEKNINFPSLHQKSQ